MAVISEREMFNYLSDKNIAVVGNARTIRKQGEEIDSHDVIIRFNNFEINGFEELVGTKTHIWILVPFSANASPTVISKLIQANSFEFCWYPHGTILPCKNCRNQCVNNDHQCGWHYPQIDHLRDNYHRLIFSEIYLNEKDAYYKSGSTLQKLKTRFFLNTSLKKSLNEHWQKSPELLYWRSICSTAPPSSGIRILSWLLNRSYKFNIYGFDGLRSVHYFDQVNDNRKNSMVVKNIPVHNIPAEIKFFEFVKTYLK
jgi:hypothetical protein